MFAGVLVSCCEARGVLSRDSQREPAGPAKKSVWPDSNFGSTDGFRYALALLRSPSDFVRIGSWNLLFKPSINSDANYPHSTSCQIPPADREIGQIFISADYVEKFRAHILKEKCVWILECFEMNVDTDGKTQTDGNIFRVLFRRRETYDENTNEDPTYHPNSTVKKKKVFMQYADNMLLKLTLGTTEVKLHENVFRFHVANGFTNVVRSREKKKKPLFLYLVELKLEENRLGFFGPNFKCQHFPYAQKEYFSVHGGTDFHVGTLSVKDISSEIVILVCCPSCNVMCVCLYS
ncbi:ankyrin and armadillo repeat-containing protein [Alca torda]